MWWIQGQTRHTRPLPRLAEISYDLLSVGQLLRKLIHAFWNLARCLYVLSLSLSLSISVSATGTQGRNTWYFQYFEAEKNNFKFWEDPGPSSKKEVLAVCVQAVRVVHMVANLHPFDVRQDRVSKSSRSHRSMEKLNEKPDLRQIKIKRSNLL